MTDWKLAARALDPRIPEEDLAGIAATLESLEQTFRPLARCIPHEAEPAVEFNAPREDEV
jgi:hypothetical protein